MQGVWEMKLAYLTIDDAPSKDFKKKVNFLINKKIPAIIFCRGSNIDSNTEKDIIYTIKKGFIIGNHTINHYHFSEQKLNTCLDEIRRMDELVEEIYKKAKIKRPIKVFRFPYGDKGGKNKRKIQKYLKSLGYRQPRFEKIKYLWYKLFGLNKTADVFWTFNLKEYQIGRDYKKNTIKDILKLIDNSKRLKSNSRDIILIHDHDYTTKYFNLLIETLLKKKIKFIKPKIK